MKAFEVRLSSYADDHQLYISGNNVGDVIQTLQRDGKTTGAWYKANHLEGNMSKYRVMVLGNTSETSSAIEIDNVTIKRESSIQLLGDKHWMRGSIVLGTSRKFVPRPQEDKCHHEASEINSFTG